MLSDGDWRLIQALDDIQQALSAWTFFMDVPETITEIERRRFMCFHDTAVVSYWRPFSDSKGLPKLSFSKAGISATRDEKHLHDRLRDYRNKIVAHTDKDRMRVLLMAKPVTIDGPMWPMVARDEGFEFLNDQRDVEHWLRKLRHGLGERVFTLVQSLEPEQRFELDYLK